ncbi:MAG: nicotinate-nucleotide adenylyltransferase [Actinobacteria bacterium]|nr:nicotinate-nucleotide adenylyltransferase [Actinomycetota bacterium]MBW3649288.1 nicotinate-nucleotide adenylyltransferase [Actinomycetota bacterium]
MTFPPPTESGPLRGGPHGIGVLGGTFDPVHIGHLVAAVEVRHALGLDQMLLMLAGQPWQKVGSRRVTPAADRLAVLEAALREAQGLEPSTLEIDRGGASYTADTLAELRERWPQAGLHVVVGADVAAELGTWVRVEEVKAMAELVVVGRPGAAAPLEQLAEEGWRVTPVSIPPIGISSSEVRARVAAGRPIDYLVPAAAIHEIAKRGLYAARR